MKRGLVVASLLFLALLASQAFSLPGASPRPPVTISIRVEPSDIPLFGSRSEGHVIVTARRADGSVVDVTPEAVLLSSNPKMVVVGKDRVLRHVSDGDATLTVKYAGQTARADVRVKNAAKRAPIEFAREVVPILTRAGCNQGTCHGSQYGKGGFKLSLSGFDPDVDYYSIVKQSGGRRAILTDPIKSLLLLKPTATLPHQGGQRLQAGSQDYNRLIEWMQDGAPGPSPKDAVVTRIEVALSGM
jgi:hypothetical protein